MGIFNRKEEENENQRDLFRVSKGEGENAMWSFGIDTTHPGHILFLLRYLVMAEERLKKSLELLGYEEKLDEWDEEEFRESLRDSYEEYDNFEELWASDKEES